LVTSSDYVWVIQAYSDFARGRFNHVRCCHRVRFRFNHVPFYQSLLAFAYKQLTLYSLFHSFLPFFLTLGAASLAPKWEEAAAKHGGDAKFGRVHIRERSLLVRLALCFVCLF
jgi:hypothetical protein